VDAVYVDGENEASVGLRLESPADAKAGKYEMTVAAMVDREKAELKQIALVNSGTAPLRGIELTSSEPSGWSISFDQAQIAEIPAGQPVDMTARIKPPEKAIAGDYVVTINARPINSKVETAEFRITVRTSTLWGVAGIGLIALAVGVIGLAVVRFGRRWRRLQSGCSSPYPMRSSSGRRFGLDGSRSWLRLF
jgi:uncharacterized membrane protein